jgi:hypothetical protein
MTSCLSLDAEVAAVNARDRLASRTAAAIVGERIVLAKVLVPHFPYPAEFFTKPTIRVTEALKPLYISTLMPARLDGGLVRVRSRGRRTVPGLPAPRPPARIFR